MKMRRLSTKTLSLSLALLLFLPQVAMAQGTDESRSIKQEELDQLLAPIALYPDSLLTQVLMASTYPLEVVQASRWAKQNKDLKGDAVAEALEKQPWDPSIKSLVNFPQVLDMMNEKLEWSQKLGDAFLAQEKDVMATVQRLRAKAQTEGNLKTTKEQVVKVEKEVVIIESASPQVIYVPAYNPTVVYGVWPYPAYPPYYYYPPGYVAGAAFTFAAGVAVGAAWGYAWGHCNWHGGEVNIDINRNTNINTNIDRSRYQSKVTTGPGGRGKWQHNPEHRKGVAYRDAATAQRFNKAGTRDVQSRYAYRGRFETSSADLDSGRADQGKDRSADRRQELQDRDADRASDRAADGRQDLQGRGDAVSLNDSGAQQRRDAGGLESSGHQLGSDKSAFGGQERGSQTKEASGRGHESLSSSRADSAGSMSRGSGGGGGRGGGRRR